MIRFWIFLAAVAVAIPTGIIGAHIEVSNQNLISTASDYGITRPPPDYVGYVAIIAGLVAFWAGPVIVVKRWLDGIVDPMIEAFNQRISTPHEIVSVFQDQYGRSPTVEEVYYIQQMQRQRRNDGLLGLGCRGAHGTSRFSLTEIRGLI